MLFAQSCLTDDWSMSNASHPGRWQMHSIGACNTNVGEHFCTADTLRQSLATAHL